MACKRCPLRPLLTPFWSPIKHLSLCYFITNWFPVGYKPAFYMGFCLCFQMFYSNLCNEFSWSFLCFWSIKKKRDSMSEGDKRVDGWESLLCLCSILTILSIEAFYCALTLSNRHFESGFSLLKKLFQIVFTTRSRGGVVH